MDLWIDHVSFSQLSTVQECPYQYYLLKIAGIEPADNGFAQAGSLAHRLLADWAKGTISKEEMMNRWIEEFPIVVKGPFPKYLKGYAAKLFDNILKYFESFDGFAGYEILGAEKEFRSSLAGESFLGIIDLILRDKKTGGLVIVDHKSCSLSSFKKNRESMFRQLLLYSKYCADEFGVFPERLAFNLFKEGVIEEKQFHPEDYVTARLWAESIVEDIKRREITDWFEVKPEFFKCTSLCSCRNECSFGRPENHKRKESSDEQKRAVSVA